MISLDTETTGVDLRHGARPFFVTIAQEDGTQSWWEWDVDPLTRTPVVPADDLAEVAKATTWGEYSLVLQNSKFDVAALTALFSGRNVRFFWPWDRTHDTLLAGHLLASNQPHDLTSMTLHYLGVDLEPYEKAVQKATMEARRIVQRARLRVKRRRARVVSPIAPRLFGGEAGDDNPEDAEPLAAWRIAEADLPEMPSAGEKTWKYDMWLPRAMRRAGHGPPEWDTVLRDYANADSAATIALWRAMEAELKRRGLWEIYLASRPRQELAYRLEQRGVTYSRARLEELRADYQQEAAKAGRICCTIANGLGHELVLPKGGVNGSLREFCFDVLKLEPVRNTKAKTAAPTLNKGAIDYYLRTLPPNSQAITFIRNLVAKRKRDTALAYMEDYERFGRPLRYKAQEPEEDTDWWRLHPSVNPTGTDTMRWSSNHPNEQNISKQEGFNLRYCFGPAPGREWWSMDAKNLELRIPAYEAGEEAFISLFERPDEPPYFGSNHLLIAHLLFPREFDECIREGLQTSADDGFKKRYKATLYQRVKNGNFAVQYGAIDRADGMGTADRTYGLPGAQARIKQRFVKQEELNRRYIRFAERHGYVETLPDRTVDPKRGYPLLCTRTEHGRILPTVPLNYHVQGTACWWMMQAMVRCQMQLDEWRARDDFDGFITLQVHDELVFDFPKGRIHPQQDRGKFRLGSNLWRIRILQRIMEQCGEDLIPRVPTPVGAEYHAEHWAEGVAL